MALSLFCALCLPATATYAQYDDYSVSYDDFYQNLSPYGQWIEDPQYGYVWSPNVDGNFRPYYTNGHWSMTEYGNTWVSDYNWGWAAFHYGRWTYDTYYGWLWIPGTTWGPAWVSWRGGDGYYGWAPLGPGYDAGPGYASYNCPNDWWVFIPPQYIYSGNYYHYWYGPRGNSRIVRNTTVINNTFVNNNVTYVTGPHAAQVKQVTGNPVQVFHVRNSKNMNTRIHNNEIRMFRPAEIRQTPLNSTARVIPPNVVTAPQPVRAAQPVTTATSTAPAPFRSTIPDNSRNVTPGTNVNETAQPAQPRQHNETRPYEWDVNRTVPQGEPMQPQRQVTQQPASDLPQQQQNPRQSVYQPQQPQQPVRQAPQPQQSQPVRQAPPPQQAQPQPVRQAPAPQQPQPVRQAPQAPAQQQGRR